MKTPNHLGRKIARNTAAGLAFFAMAACGSSATGNEQPEHGIIFHLSTRTFDPDYGQLCLNGSTCLLANGDLCIVNSGSICLDSGRQETDYTVSISDCKKGENGPELATVDFLKSLTPQNYASIIATSGTVNYEANGKTVTADCATAFNVAKNIYSNLTVGTYY